MQLYNRSAGSLTRIRFGTELIAGLTGFDESAPLAEAVQAINERLAAALRARMELDEPVRKARAAMRIREYHVDRVLRGLDAATRIADSGPRGPIRRTLFPDGLTPVAAPRGRRQVPPARALFDRMRTTAIPGIGPLREEWMPRLQVAIEALESAVGELEAHLAAEREAFLLESAVRDEHLLAMQRVVGQVKALFPGDRARQKALFPPVGSSRRSADDADAPPEVEGVSDAA